MGNVVRMLISRERPLHSAAHLSSRVSNALPCSAALPPYSNGRQQRLSGVALFRQRGNSCASSPVQPCTEGPTESTRRAGVRWQGRQQPATAGPNRAAASHEVRKANAAFLPSRVAWAAPPPLDGLRCTAQILLLT